MKIIPMTNVVEKKLTSEFKYISSWYFNAINTTYINISNMESLVIIDFIFSFSSSGFLFELSMPDFFDDCLLELLHVVLKYLILLNLGEKLNLLLHNNVDCTVCNSLRIFL